MDSELYLKWLMTRILLFAWLVWATMAFVLHEHGDYTEQAFLHGQEILRLQNDIKRLDADDAMVLAEVARLRAENQVLKELFTKQGIVWRLENAACNQQLDTDSVPELPVVEYVPVSVGGSPE